MERGRENRRSKAGGAAKYGALSEAAEQNGSGRSYGALLRLAKRIVGEARSVGLGEDDCERVFRREEACGTEEKAMRKGNRSCKNFFTNGKKDLQVHDKFVRGYLQPSDIIEAQSEK